MAPDAAVSPTDRAEPFVKWAGGKRLLIPQLLPHFPSLIKGRYFEPFLGGGAVFFSLKPASAFLSDVNSELLDTYATVRTAIDEVIAELSLLPHNKKTYYAVRRSRPPTAAARAARFIYLNKTCFNGLYRVNLAGEFNVPYGRHGRSLVVCDAAQLRAASMVLRNAELATADFAEAVSGAQDGDVVYFDPPYTVAHSNNGFIEYNAKVFAWQDQSRLAALAEALVARGVLVLISNADHPSIARLYGAFKHFDIHRLFRFSTMAGSALKRGATSELLIVGKRD